MQAFNLQLETRPLVVEPLYELRLCSGMARAEQKESYPPSPF